MLCRPCDQPRQQHPRRPRNFATGCQSGSSLSILLKYFQIVSCQTCDYCRTLDEEDVIRKAFELCFAYDEIISTAGYRYAVGKSRDYFFSIFFSEKVTIQQIGQFLEMDSQDEKLFEMIERVRTFRLFRLHF